MSEPLPAPVRLEPVDAERYVRLRRQMLEDAPWAFSATPADDKALDVAHVGRLLAEEHNAIVAISEGELLVACAGIARGKPPKFSHRARIWGVFVAQAHRGKGLGTTVMTAAVELARSWTGVDYIDIGVSEGSPDARRLYERLGFDTWGRLPETTETAGRRYDEIFMVLKLTRG